MRSFFTKENTRSSGGMWDIENYAYAYIFDASRVVPVAEENRPINKAVRIFY